MRSLCQSPSGLRRRTAFAGLVSVIAASLFAGCTGVRTLSFPPPPATPPVAVTSTTVTPDLTGVPLGSVSGQTTTTAVALGPGRATINGVVAGPGGPVAGATVEADRFVGSSLGSQQVTTGQDGAFSFLAILGGRYRVRAWQQPALAMATPEIFFLGGTETMSLNLQVTAFTGQSVSSAVNPMSAAIGENIDVVVAVSNQTVGLNGVVNYVAAPGVSVSLSGGTAVSVNSPAVSTDGTGTASFLVTCVMLGTASLIGTTGAGASTFLPTITCANPAPPSTTSTSSSIPIGSSTTTPVSTSLTTVAGVKH